MTKGDKIIKNNIIICRNHKKKDKSKKKEKKDTKEQSKKIQKDLKYTKSSKRKKEDLLPLEYFDVILPENEDYSNRKEPWCRYCGARHSRKFYDSPLGEQTLCDIHYKIMRKQ